MKPRVVDRTVVEEQSKVWAEVGHARVEGMSVDGLFLAHVAEVIEILPVESRHACCNQDVRWPGEAVGEDAKHPAVVLWQPTVGGSRGGDVGGQVVYIVQRPLFVSRTEAVVEVAPHQPIPNDLPRLLPRGFRIPLLFDKETNNSATTAPPTPPPETLAPTFVGLAPP